MDGHVVFSDERRLYMRAWKATRMGGGNREQASAEAWCAILRHRKRLVLRQKYAKRTGGYSLDFADLEIGAW